MYVCMWDELVTWGFDLCWSYLEVGFEATHPGMFYSPICTCILFCGGCCFANNLCYAIMEYYTIIMPPICACVFVLWKLLLCQQFVLRHNGVLHNHHATHLHMRFCFVEVVALPTICVDAIMEYCTIIMPPPTRNSMLKVQRGFPQSLICHRMSSKFQRAHSHLIIHSQCWELLWKEE